MDVLYFTPLPSHPLVHGSFANIYQFARRIQEFGHKVHFVLLGENHNPGDYLEMDRAWDTFDVLPFSVPIWPDLENIKFDGWYEEGLGEKIAALCQKYRADVLFCTFVFQSKILEFVPDSVLKVIATQDKFSDRYAMLHANGLPSSYFSCSPEDEGAYLRRADIAIAQREEEARHFDSVSGRDSALVVPYFEGAKFLDRAYTGLGKVGVVASGNPLNVAMVGEFLDSIRRTLAGKPCPFVVNIAGAIKDEVQFLSQEKAAAFRQPWVEMLGFVEDIGEFYQDMDLLVSPVTMGTGINIKTVQALAYGVPLLATAWGMKGIETGDARHSCESMDALAKSLLELHGDPEEINRLAEVSRSRYRRFLSEGDEALRSVFTHEKVVGR